ncbi:von Willebrand factor A domain-containing protein 8 [Grifola frondosa]|uniref:von Willebrand factor A domain-containing protein 8 n=1 Tax=Grifola frondosa TaxID=5627 RepID=A0A1C7MIB8_GRIFR|nr:von Willebrand factor A domain-containing protein 8 [Grifola frondosa]
MRLHLTSIRHIRFSSGIAHNMAQRRLKQILSELTPPPLPIGTLKLGDITHEVHAALTPSRLPHCEDGLLDTRDPFNLDNLHFMLQKYILGQDIFLLSQPELYHIAARLEMFALRLINSEYEFIALHRDIGETELKQGREIRAGGNLVYVDSAAVRAVKLGRILILEGIEKAERGIMPVLNNLLENREMNLDDGTHIIHPHRYALLNSDTCDTSAGIPPYPGYPLDPPFRSRFQARFVDPVGALMALNDRGHLIDKPSSTSSALYEKLRNIIISTQFASESRHSLDAVAKSTLPAFPQTALVKLRNLLSLFPPPPHLTPAQLARLMLTIHPALIHSPFVAWATLSQQTEDSGLGPLGSPSLAGDADILGLLGYRLVAIERLDDSTARVSFKGASGTSVAVDVSAGPRMLLRFPFSEPKKLGFFATPRFMGILTCMIQAHALGWDISYIPPALPSTASCSTTLLVDTFGAVLGYEVEDVHMYKELGGRELIMRRKIEDGGATTWEPSPLIEGAWSGRLVHLSGLDVIGSTAGSIARLMQDREVELWETKRIVTQASEEEKASGELSVTHPSFRIISTASKSLPLKDWLSDEQANMFFPIAAQPMSREEEYSILKQTGCPAEILETLLTFADKYRSGMTSDTVQKNRKLGTRSLVRIARRVARFPGDNDLHSLLSRSILAEFLPATEAMNLDNLFEETGIRKQTPKFNPLLLFKKQDWCSLLRVDQMLKIPYPHSFRSLTGLRTLKELSPMFHLEVLDEHLVLLGNQGVGKNKVVDRLCQLLGRPREYIQLHRDTTVNQLMFHTVLEGGVIKYTDSPLLRAITLGRVIVIDEADKAAEHVVAIFRSLAGHGQLSLADGRRVRRTPEREVDIVVHPNFRLILLANRPGYPFLGNHFLQVLGDNFSCHAVTNPDMSSERKLLSQLAPELSQDMILRLVAAFQDLRHAYDHGALTYPYSLRELINIVRHMQAYPNDSLESTLRNVFDFDVYKPDTIAKLADILDHHGLIVKNLGFDAARAAARKQVLDLKFEPTGDTSLSKPKYGKEDPDNQPHTGGNTWAGGTGGRDTAGLGGRGGYMRLFKGHDINQIPDALKNDVPDHIKEQARQMARQELARRLEELNMSAGEAKGYGSLLTAVQAHIVQLHDLLENLSAKEEERVWVKRQTDGELDDSRLTEGLTGEATVYKRRGMAKPEMGRPQIKPKRIRFLFDVSASMVSFPIRWPLEEKYGDCGNVDGDIRSSDEEGQIYGHSGDSAEIPLVESDKLPTELHDRWKVVEKMEMITQYTFAGDYTVEAIEKAVADVAKFDADDWFVIAVTDANFARYNITAEDLQRAMSRHPKVNTALIYIGEGAEASWIPKKLPGHGYRVSNTADIPAVLRSILSTMVDKS